MIANFAMISAYRQARSICGRHKVRREKDIKTERRVARRRTANFTMILTCRRTMPIYGRYEIRREKRYQDGAERDEKKDCKFCDDFGISAGEVDMRSLQVRREKDIKTERRGARERENDFSKISERYGQGQYPWVLAARRLPKARKRGVLLPSLSLRIDKYNNKSK